MGILLDKIKEDNERVEASYWGLIFDICDTIRTDSDKYYDVMKDKYNSIISLDIGRKKCIINIFNINDSLIFSVEVDSVEVLRIKLVGNSIVQCSNNIPAGKTHIEELKSVYALL